MVPRTFPSTYETVNGETRMVVFFLSSVSGLTKWVDYIPVKFPMLETQVSNSYNNDGVVLVDPLSSTTNRQAWVDYIPVFVDANDTAAWRVNATGYIPVGFAVKPTLNLDFADTKTLDPRITFTRASSATYFDANGVLQTAGSGVARFDHNATTGESLGLLIEQQRTNLVLQSEDFLTTWTNENVVRTTNTTAAPNGTTTADTIASNSTNAAHSVTQSISFTNGQSYTLSVFAKKGTGNFVQLRVGSAVGGAFANFDLDTGVVGTLGKASGNDPTSTITSFGNGWYRCTMTVVVNATASTVAGFYVTTSASATGAEAHTSILNVILWGAQLEAGAFPTSYIPTVAATVTRNADVATMTGTNFSSWYSQGQGTVYTEILRQNTTGFPGRIRFSDGTANNIIDLYFDAASNSSTYEIKNAGVANVQIFGGGGTLNSFIKAAAAWENNNAAVCYNGSIQGSDTSTTIPATIDQIRLANALNGYVRRISFYPARLSNAQLQALTR